MSRISLVLILLSGTSIWASAAFHLPLSRAGSSGRVMEGPGCRTQTAQVSFCCVFGRETLPPRSSMMTGRCITTRWLQARCGVSARPIGAPRHRLWSMMLSGATDQVSLLM